MDHALSKFILELYQHTSLIDENDFQLWALEQTKKLVHFDSAQWAEGHINRQKLPHVHRFYLYKQPFDKIENYRKIHQDLGLVDPFVGAIASNPGKTFSWRDIAESDDVLWSTPLYEFHCKKYQEEHIAVTAIPHYDCEFFSVISLYRNDRSRPFTDEEKRTKEIITPHLIESYRICLQSHIFSKLLTVEHNSIALVNAVGRLFIRMDTFIDTFNQISEVPIKENAIQDQTLLELIQNKYDGYIKKTHLASRALPNGLFLVILNRDPLLQKLTPREIEATILANQGKSYKEISEIMCIAENTVRSFLRNAREKFGVSTTRQIDI